MALDALGDQPVELRVNGSCDSLDAALSLMDTIDTVGVVINATVVGAASGTLVGVVAVCCRRTMGPSGRLHLREPSDRYQGTATEIERLAGALGQRFDAYLHRLAGATGRPFEHLEAAHRIGMVLDAGQALDYGLVDEIAGFRPR
jgi:ATP-dependent Clp protease protease subunit